MKKHFLLLTVLSILFTGCEKNNNTEEGETDKEYQYNPDKVFDQSAFMGVWEPVEQYFGKYIGWKKYPSCPAGRTYLSFTLEGIADFYDCKGALENTKYKPGTWSFDHKNTMQFKIFIENIAWGREEVVQYLSLVHVSENEIIGYQTFESYGNPGSGMPIRYRKTALAMDDYYHRYTYGLKVKDTTGLVFHWHQEEDNHSYLIGTRNEKLWVGVFDTNSKEQLFEATNSEKFNWIKRIHLGYGEYKDEKIKKISIQEVDIENKRIIFNAETENYVSYYSLWFTETNITYDLRSKTIFPWSNESILAEISDENLKWVYTCLDKNGGILFNGSSNYYAPSTSFPIDLYDFISFRQGNLRMEDGSWRKTIEVCISSFDANKPYYPDYKKVLKQLPYPKTNDFKYEVTLLEKKSQIWTFRIDIAEYSGEKHSHTVDIDITADAMP